MLQTSSQSTGSENNANQHKHMAHCLDKDDKEKSNLLAHRPHLLHKLHGKR